MNTFSRLIEGLTRADAYPQVSGSAAGPVEHLETHISHIFLVGDSAYKLKKPLDLGFLDFSTLERRRFYCAEEVRLNRRLAPALYLGVLPVTGTPERPRIGGDGPALEYAVHMRRFAQDALLTRCALTPELIDRIAERVAAFHAQAPQADRGRPFGTPRAVLEPMLDNLRQVREQVLDHPEARRLDRLTAWTMARWRALTPAIERRRADGRVRECHGDLHRGNIALVDGEPLLFDAIEFNPGLRWIDTASELAFLIMDLEEAGEPGLARRLLNRYLELGGDFGALAVLDLYKVYRAMVRAKVLAIRLHQAGLDGAEATADRQACAGYLALAESYTRARRPRLLIACGLSGSGKSQLAADLREVLPLIHVRSDVERKRLFGLCPEARSRSDQGAGIYSTQATEWTHRRLHDLAAAILDCGYDVLVDATFLTRGRRAAFHDLANRRGAGFAVLALVAPLEVLRQRVADRLAAGDDASEASLAVLDRQRSTCEHLSLAERLAAVIIHSADPPPLAQTLARIAELTGVGIGD